MKKLERILVKLLVNRGILRVKLCFIGEIVFLCFAVSVCFVVVVVIVSAVNCRFFIDLLHVLNILLHGSSHSVHRSQSFQLFISGLCESLG